MRQGLLSATLVNIPATKETSGMVKGLRIGNGKLSFVMWILPHFNSFEFLT